MVLYIDGSRSRYAETDVLPPKKKRPTYATVQVAWSSIGGSPGLGVVAVVMRATMIVWGVILS